MYKTGSELWVLNLETPTFRFSSEEKTETLKKKMAPGKID
jgi:hypothetical protein